MIKGIGIDIVELERIKRLLSKQPKFLTRILTEKEIAVWEKLSDRRKVEYAAGRFAAKEAFSKARGTGIGKELNFQDIEILPNELGKPLINAVHTENERVHLSISHSQEYAVANVIIECLSS
jgi:holo-[acyl-carrier protein] synthase